MTIIHCRNEYLTVTLHSALAEPSALVALIVAVPLPVIFTLPESSTVATFVFDDSHLISFAE